MLKIVNRYLAFSFIPPFVGCMIFFVFFLIISQLFKIVGIVLSKDVSFFVILQIVGNIALAFIPWAMPLSAFVASFYTLNKLSEDSEIIAMRSFGSSKFDLLKPFLLIGVLVAFAIFSLSMGMVPNASFQFRNTLVQLTSKGLLENIKQGQFFTDIPGVVLFAEKVKQNGTVLDKIFIQQKKSGSNVNQIVFADKGELIKFRSSEYQIDAIKLKLYNGNIARFSDENKGVVDKMSFEEHEYPVWNGIANSDFITKDTMLTFGQLRKKMEQDKRALKGNEKLSSGALKTHFEYWDRINTPILVILFLVLGFCLGIKKGRSSSQNTGAIGFAIIVFYYAIYFGLLTVARKTIIPPYSVVTLSTLFLYFVTFYLYKKLDWNT